MRPDEHRRGVPRESDLEKKFVGQFREYEEWRSSVAGTGEPASEQEERKQEKKGGGLTRWDLMFIILGVVAGLVYQSCKAAR